MANANLGAAKTAKNDEFYTQYPDIEKEMNAYLEYNPDVFRGKTVLLPCDDPEWSNFTLYFAQNFERLGLKKLISTSFAQESKKYKTPYVPSLFEQDQPQYNPTKSQTHGKIFVIDRDVDGDGHIDIHDIHYEYLEGDGDFRSAEVTRLRDEADIIITNPPFSLFREFLAWIVEGGKQFSIIGNMNAVGYKEVFPLIKNNIMWMGSSYFNGGAAFFIADAKRFDPNKMSSEKNAYFENGKFLWRVNGVRWYTNIEHGRRHEPLSLMTMADNLKFSKHKELRGRKEYVKYANFDALEVPYADSIPSDYDGIMGVPRSFFDKYCPDQFEIIGSADDVAWAKSIGVRPMGQDVIKNLRDNGNKAHVTANMCSLYYINEDNKVILPYARILIRKRKQQ